MQVLLDAAALVELRDGARVAAPVVREDDATRCSWDDDLRSVLANKDSAWDVR